VDAYGSEAAVKDNTPTPSGRLDPRLDPAANPAPDPAEDTDEPAFDWMKPAPAARAAEEEGAAGPAASQPESRADRKAAEAAAADGAGAAEAGRDVATDRKTEFRQPSAAGSSSMGTHYSEPLPTSALQVRPPQEEVERRNAEREQAARAKPVLPRFLQVLLAIFYPVVLLVLAVRAVTSPLFLWVEYHRPGFPGDGYGFNRTTA
jgi:hypothetical protein